MDGSKSELYEYDGVEEKIILLNDNGDFCSEECTKIKEQSDIIVSNPPFSLFREIIDWLDDKDFILLGNQNAITYKNIFPKIMKGTIRLGVTLRGGSVFFEQPTIFDNRKIYKINGKNCVCMGCIHWFTTLDHGFQPKPIPLVKKYTPEAYPKYDNYDAINVDKTKDIPMDYEGVMGVPITFLDKYCTEQFEILGITDSQNTSGLRTKKYTEEDDPKFNALNARSVIIKNGIRHPLYARILIRNKKPRNNY